MAERDLDPLVGGPAPRIVLSRSPLTGVVAQLRFAEIFLLQKQDFVAPFQDRIRRAGYPLPQQEKSISIQVADGAPALKTGTTWKFSDAENVWTITLASDFVALATNAYTSREDFKRRFSDILEAMAETIAPTLVTRIGVRYVNRISGPQLSQLHELFRPEIASFSASTLRDRIERSLTEALCKTKEGELLLRWGVMPETASHDLTMLPPIKERSWILDLDAFSEYQPPQVFDPSAAVARVYELATRANTFFYWAVKDKFVEVFGGKS